MIIGQDTNDIESFGESFSIDVPVFALFLMSRREDYFLEVLIQIGDLHLYPSVFFKLVRDDKFVGEWVGI